MLIGKMENLTGHKESRSIIFHACMTGLAQPQGAYLGGG